MLFCYRGISSAKKLKSIVPRTNLELRLFKSPGMYAT